jgi:hypothetical protein
MLWDVNSPPGVARRCLWGKIRGDHFTVRSLEEFDTIKRLRARGDTPRGRPRFVRDGKFFDKFNRNDICDPMATRRWV